MLVKCKNERCKAEYSRGEWVSGVRSGSPNDTSGNNHFIPYGRIPVNVCPMCRTPEEEAE